MNPTRLQSRLAFAAGELAREAQGWTGPTKADLVRASRQAMAASAAVHHTTARKRRAAEALLEAALDMVARHAMARLNRALEAYA